MQVVVPAAGRGQRFVDEGYVGPKPLIPVMGKPLIKWATQGLHNVDDLKFIFLVLQDHIENHHIDDQLKDLYPNVEVVPVNQVTEGAACTVLLAKSVLNPDEDMAIVNCDNLFLVDLPKAKEQAGPDASGIIFYIAANNPGLSYVQTDEQGYATRVAEKEMISDRATVGCYYFSQARHFTNAAEDMIAQNIRTNNEFYVAPVYNILINQGHKIKTVPCDFHFHLGTPREMKYFQALFGT